MNKITLPRVLLSLNLLAVLLLVLLVEVKSYKFDVISHNLTLANAEKSYISGCMEQARDKDDEMTKWSCETMAKAYRRDFQKAVGLEPVKDIPLYDKIIDRLAL